MATIANLKRMSASTLASKLRERPADLANLAIVDVRDDDFIGGHIRSSLHFPSRALDASMPTLLRKLKDTDTVIFHCALSQQRGPGAALKYMREREQQYGPQSIASSTFNDAAQASASGIVAQNVYVLDRGFVGWQEDYGSDEQLTEGYRREIWENGY